MKKEIITFDEEEVFEKAKDYFIRICGFSSNEEHDSKLLERGMEARSRGLDGIVIRAVISSYEPTVFRDHRVYIEGTTFTCAPFSRIEEGMVKRIYLYLLTVGECGYSEEDGLLGQMFSDAWGTAYTEASRELLQIYMMKDLEKEHPGEPGKSIFLSKTFGPGFYGMEVKKSIDLFRILDGKRIGMQVNDSGILFPLKSCSGLFLAVTDPALLPEPGCRDCNGNVASCSFCSLRCR